MPDPPPPEPPGDVPPLPNPALEALRRVQRGTGAFVFVAGGPRQARSSLLSTLEQNAKDFGWETLRLRAHPLDGAVPYGALQPWLSQWYQPIVSGESSSPSASRAGPAFAMPLVGLIAGLPAQSAPETGPSPRSPSSSAQRTLRDRIFTPAQLRAELVDLVQGRTRKNPAVVLLEDAEFLDAASWEWFGFLGDHMFDLPIAVALSLAEEDIPDESLRERLASAPSAWCRLGGDDGTGLAREQLRGRLRALPARTLEALLLAVLAGPDSDRTTLKALLKVNDRELNLALSPAMDAGLLRLLDEHYESAEPTLYPDLAGVAKPADVASTHRALAMLISKRPTPPEGKILFRLSDHWAEAGEVGRGVPALLAASREAERWGAPELAEKRLLRAVLLSQTDPTTRGRELEEKSYSELARLRMRAGHPAEARDAYHRAISLAKERGARAVQWAGYIAGLSDAQTRLGGHPDEQLKEALAQVEGRSNELEAMLLRSLSFYYLERARFHESITTAERACELAEKGNDGVLKIRARNSAASAYIFSGVMPERARTHLLKALEHRKEIEGTADEMLLVNVMDGLSLLECGLGNEAESLRWGERSLDEARRCGYGTSLLLVLGNLPEHYIHTKDFARARELTEELRASAKRLNIPERDNSYQQLFLVEGRIAADTGDVATAKERFQKLIASSEKGGSRVFLSQALVHLTVLCARNHEMEQARQFHRRLEKEGLLKTLVGENRRLLDEVEPLLHG
ncbi:MAG: ATP-binding protein [Euryarchaeota archaeon]|nr:ATP-binding protein [Euryarchaeota archaeon]MDE1838173.1 ATP-binding protein [Euryarchaeota archaeon]MDE1882253.1 ATP-binding protein [Euryarchaeota archaeon]MDE2045789.1 ATP-binding protein [Thermoplasmata archaeon]